MSEFSGSPQCAESEFAVHDQSSTDSGPECEKGHGVDTLSMAVYLLSESCHPDVV